MQAQVFDPVTNARVLFKSKPLTVERAAYLDAVRELQEQWLASEDEEAAMLLLKKKYNQ